jgi:hypothetical protein
MSVVPYAMCLAHIAFSTSKRPKFTWIDTFEGVQDAELEELIVECRSALHSLEAEFAARQKPQVDTKLIYCYARLQDKATRINNLGWLGTKDRGALEEADTFLRALSSGHISSSQTRKTRKDGGMYKQLLWLISRVAGPEYALLLICSVARHNVERLNSFQSASLVKYVARNCDSLSCRVLEEKANEVGLLERASGKRKRCQRSPSIAWTDPMEQAGATLLTSYNPSEVNGVSPSQTGFNSVILTSASDAANNDDTNGNSALPGKVINCRAVEPQNQVAAFHRPSSRSHDDGNWSLPNETIEPAISLSASSTQTTTIPDAENLPIIWGSSISNMTPGEL